MREHRVELDWRGPFRYGKSGLKASGDGGQWATKHDLEALHGQDGLYLFCVDHPIHGEQVLAYIGRAISIGSRLAAHDKWLRAEWSVSVYAAACPERAEHVEALLIYAHSPIYNASGLEKLRAEAADLHVRNTGRYWRLFPDVHASHPWNT